MQIVPGGAQSVMSLRPFRLKPQRCLELRGRPSSFPFIFKSKGEVVMSERIVGFELQCFSVVRDRLIPGLLPREFGRCFAVAGGRLGGSGRCKREYQNKDNGHEDSLAR